MGIFGSSSSLCPVVKPVAVTVTCMGHSVIKNIKILMLRL